MSLQNADDCCVPSSVARPPGADSRQRGLAALRAMADATRIELFALIASREEPVCVCDIAAQFDQKQPTISHHLRVLREAELVTSERRGTWVFYAVDPVGLSRLQEAVVALTPQAARV